MFNTPEIRTLADYVEAANDQRSMSRRDVPRRVQNCRVWVAMVSVPGCLPHSWSVHRSRKAAADALRFHHDGAKGARQLGALLNSKGEGCEYVNGLAYEIVHNTVAEHF